MVIETELSDGTPLLIRQIGPDDKRLLVAGMRRLSERSRRQRFLTPTEQLSRAQLSYLTEIDQRDHQAWGALIDGEPVAIGRFVRTHDDEAEVALTVIDEWQKRGLGTMLLRLLAEEAERVGIKRFTFVYLPENVAIAQLLAKFGTVGRLEDGLLTASLPVSPTGRGST